MDFFPDLSVVEHLDLFARAHGVPDAEQLVDDVLEEVRLTPQAAQLPGTLSSGQKRRLALASAFVRPRRLLVLDEPEARLDQAGLVWLTERLLREKAAGLGILLASHDPDLVAAVADRVHDLDEPPRERLGRRGPRAPLPDPALAPRPGRHQPDGGGERRVRRDLLRARAGRDGGQRHHQPPRRRPPAAARRSPAWTPATRSAGSSALAAITVVLAAARLLGPMLVTPAVGTWLLTAPLDRTALVRGRLVARHSVVAALVGAALAATGAALSAYPADVIGSAGTPASPARAGVLLVGGRHRRPGRGSPAVRVLAWLLGGVLWVGLVLVARDSRARSASGRRRSPLCGSRSSSPASLAVVSLVARLPRACA